MTGNRVGEVSVAVRGDIGPLRGDLAKAKAEAQNFEKAAVQTGNAAALGIGKATESVGRFGSSLGASTAAAARFSTQVAAGMSQIGRTALLSQQANERLVAGMGRDFAQVQAAFAAATTMTSERINAANAGLMAHGAQLTSLRDKYLPLVAAQRQYAAAQNEINQAVRMGALSENERVVALKNAEMAFIAQTRAIQNAQRAMAHLRSNAALSNYQLANLSFQLNDVATMAAMGAPIMQILASQVGQIYQILQMGEGGVRGSLGYLRETLLGVITPARVATTGLLGLGAAGATVAYQWQSAQREIIAGLVGVGSAAGITSGDINRIATEAVAAGQATAGQARQMMLAFASTGRITSDVAASLVDLGKGVAVTFGEDLTEAAERLARAFADPAKGVDDLNKRLGAFDDRTRQTILSLTGQNRVLEAQRLMLEGVREATEHATEATSEFAQGWNYVRERFSEYANFVGERSALMFGYADTYTRYVDAQNRLSKLLNANENAYFEFQRALNQPGIESVTAEILQLEEAMQGLAEAGYRAKINLESVAAGDFIRRMVPDVRNLQRILDDIGRINNIRSMPGVVGSLADVDLQSLDRAEKSVNLRREFYMTSIEIAREEHRQSLATIQARSTAQRAEIAYRSEITRLRRDGDVDAEERSAMKQREIYAQSTEQLRRAGEQRLLAADQSIEAATRELDLVGQTTASRERELALLAAKQQLEDEAFRMEGDRNAYNHDHLAILQDRVKWQQELNRKIAEENTLRELSFERAQMGRSEREQRVYGRLDSLGLLTNGEIVGAQAQMIAQQVRFNEVMRLSQDASKEFASGFIRDLKDGVSATEALGNALNRLADRFLDMAMDQAFSAFFAPFSKGVAAGATAGGGGGSIFPSIFHDGGVVGQTTAPRRRVPISVFDGAPRYHNGGIAGRSPLRVGEIPAILQEGETVIPKGGGLGGLNITLNTNIDATGADAAAVARLEAAMSKRDRELPSIIQNTVRDGRMRGRV